MRRFFLFCHSREGRNPEKKTKNKIILDPCLRRDDKEEGRDDGQKRLFLV